MGKTDVASALHADAPEATVSLDLGLVEHRSIIAEPADFFAQHAGKLIILDEVQRLPAVLDAIKSHLGPRFGEDQLPCRFLLLGSSTAEVGHLCNERLGARLRVVEMAPIQPDELPEPGFGSASSAEVALSDISETASTESLAAGPSVDQLWLRGGFPRSFLASADADSMSWRQDYLRSCVGRAIPGTPEDVSPRTVENFLKELAAKPAGEFAVESLRKSHRWCLDLLIRQGLVRELRPWFTNQAKRLRKPAKLYVRDSGLLHALRGCADLGTLLHSEGLPGHSWEGFCIESLAVGAGSAAQVWFYRDEQKNEVDLILDFGGVLWAIEIKLGEDTNPRRGFYQACEVLQPARRLVVNRAQASVIVGRSIPALTIRDALAEVREFAAR